MICLKKKREDSAIYGTNTIMAIPINKTGENSPDVAGDKIFP